MAEPPLDPGALKVTLAWVSPAVAVPIVGAPATVIILLAVIPLPVKSATSIAALAPAAQLSAAARL